MIRNGETMSHDRLVRFNALLQVRGPENFIAAVDRAADKRIESRSAYVRNAVLERLCRDGIELERGAA